MVSPKPVPLDTSDSSAGAVMAKRTEGDPAPSTLMTNPAWRSKVAAPSDENEPNGPFFVKSIGYSWLALAVITMTGSLGFTWFRRGASIASEMLMWDGTFSPLVIATLIGPAAALILIGKWMQRRADRR